MYPSERSLRCLQEDLQLQAQQDPTGEIPPYQA